MKRIALFFLAVTGVLSIWSSPAVAHNTLVEARPAKEARLDKAPAEVRLLFLAALPQSTKLTVTDAAGASAIGAVTIAGKEIAAPFTAAASGTYTVTYELVSADGHPVKNSYSFTLALPAPVVETIPSSQAPALSPTPSPIPAAQSETKKTPWFPVIGGAALAGLLVGAFIAFLKSRRRRAGA